MRERPLILIVDDEDSFREIMSVKLNAAGFDCVVAKDGKEGATQAAKLMPDLILMDIHMPGGTGTDAALMIKQNPKTKNVKVAFLTSLKEPWPTIQADHQKLSQAIGMEDFLEKTDDLDSTVANIREILARK